MARIATYGIDAVVSGGDKWIGSDVSNANATMNFTPDNLSLYYIKNGFVEPSRAGLIYIYQAQNTDNKGVFQTIDALNNTSTIQLDNTLNEIIVSKLDNNRVSQEAMLNFLNGHTIKIITPERNKGSNYAVYSVTNVTEHTDTDYMALTLTFVQGNPNATITTEDVVTLSSVGGGTGSGTSTPNTIITGTGVPANTLGNRGDFYVDTDTTTWYGPKTTVWGPGVSLIGPAGTNGENGDSLDLSVTDNRSTTGDYVITITQTTYDADNNPTTTTPVNNLNIIGPRGPMGNNGSSILNGTVDPANTLGNDGDTYINTVSHDLFVKADGAWTNVGSLRGAPGADGDSVTNVTQPQPNQLLFTLRSGTTFGPFDLPVGPTGPRGLFDLEIYIALPNTTAAPVITVQSGYNSATNTITSLPTGWTRDIPNHDASTTTLWESRFQVVPVENQDTYTVTWSPVFQAGGIGPAGSSVTARAVPNGVEILQDGTVVTTITDGTDGTIVAPDQTPDPADAILRGITIAGTSYRIPEGSNPNAGSLTNTRGLTASFSVPTGAGEATGIVNLLPSWDVTQGASVTSATITGPGIVNPINAVSGTAINLPSQTLAVGTHTWTLTLVGTDNLNQAETETATGSIRITVPARTQDTARAGFGPATLTNISTFSDDGVIRPNMIDVDSTGTAGSSNFYWVLVDRDITIAVIEDAAGPVGFDAVQTVTIGSIRYNGYKSSQTEFDFGGDDSIQLTLRYS